MAVRKLKSSWWVDFRYDHVRYRKRSPDNSRAGAIAYESQLRQRLARGGRLDSERDQQPTFEQFAWRWFEDYAKPNNKYSEQMAKKYILSSSLMPFFGSMPVGAIGAHD